MLNVFNNRGFEEGGKLYLYIFETFIVRINL